MHINKSQQEILQGFQCKRVCNIDASCLHHINGPLIDGTNRSSLINHFRNDKHIDDDKNGYLASYVITNKNDEILLFFSIRCGELFEKIDLKKMELGRKAYEGVNKLQNTPNLTKQDASMALQDIKNALNAGLNYDDFKYFAYKTYTYIGDVSKEPCDEVSRVSTVYSGVELKFFGINDNTKKFWDDLNFPKKMGETLFWYFIVPKLEDLREIVGCQFLYLFAADRDADGSLVTYYRTVLHLDGPPGLSYNKPYFDYQSMFLYQDIAHLMEQRDLFFSTFNPDIEDVEIV